MMLLRRNAVNVSAGFVLVALVGLAPVAAQADSHSKQKLPEAPKQLPSVKAHGKSLDFLFDALKAAPDEESARAVEARIWAIWMKTPSDTVALLMARTRVALENDQSDVAMKLLDAIIKLHPDYVEAWNKRATLYYMKNDYNRAMEDIEEVLRREPRHFGALAGLGVILEETGDDRHALEVFRRALVINPHLDKVPEMVKSLSEKVEGRDI
ncbi:MAG: tetratricopeptide repeat protein [Afipia felis]|nr:tetratricopeptide repeat protein [Afipia felis]